MKCDVLFSQGSVRTIFRWGGYFSYMSKKIYSSLQQCKNYKNRSRFSKVMITNVLPLFYGSQCMYNRNEKLNRRIVSIWNIDYHHQQQHHHYHHYKIAGESLVFKNKVQMQNIKPPDYRRTATKIRTVIEQYVTHVIWNSICRGHASLAMTRAARGLPAVGRSRRQRAIVSQSVCQW